MSSLLLSSDRLGDRGGEKAANWPREVGLEVAHVWYVGDPGQVWKDGSSSEDPLTWVSLWLSVPVTVSCSKASVEIIKR